jgi:hypothetical protein
LILFGLLDTRSNQQSPMRNLEHRSENILIDFVTLPRIDKDIWKTMFQIAYRRLLIAEPAGAF